MGKIVAVVSRDRALVGGGVPVFIVQGEEELQRIAFYLEKILNAAAHDLQNGTIIIVNHNSQKDM